MTATKATIDDIRPLAEAIKKLTEKVQAHLAARS